VIVRLTPKARQHLLEIEDYISATNPAAARAVVDRVKSRLSDLRTFPYIGRPGRRRGTRELVISGTPYIAAYRVDKRAVVVLGVIHGARRWPRRF
jgi:toxin ParE1/3/4